MGESEKMIVYGVRLSFEDIEKQVERYKEGMILRKREKIVRLRKPEDQLRMLAGDYLIGYMMKQYFGTDVYKHQIAYTEYEKPYLEDKPDFYFNISHSGNWVIGAYSAKPIGVDVEKISPMHSSIIRRVGTKEEQVIYEKLSEEEKMEKLYDLWTIKESYSKQVGKGLHIPFDEININEEEECVYWKEEKMIGYFKRIKGIESYKMVVTSSEREAASFKVLDLDQVVEG